jgi:hypothetical protein
MTTPQNIETFSVASRPVEGWNVARATPRTDGG